LQVTALLKALQSYRADTGEFPTEAQGLQALRVNPGVRAWKGPYLAKDIPPDPWDEAYRYRVDSSGAQVFSLGGGSPKGERTILVEGFQ
jgi:general secretion pathway protein G